MKITILFSEEENPNKGIYQVFYNMKYHYKLMINKSNIVNNIIYLIIIKNNQSKIIIIVIILGNQIFKNIMKKIILIE